MDITPGHRERTCKACASPFLVPIAKGRPPMCCSQACASTQRRGNRYLQGLSPATIGGMNELRAAADLVGRGYHVFRSVVADGPIDLVAMTPEGMMLRVEVRTGQATLSGYVWKQNHHDVPYDVAAIVLPDRVVYEPDMPIIPRDGLGYIGSTLDDLRVS